MADDKGSSGGKWEPFEVVIVILLAIGLLSRFQSNSTKRATSTTTKPKSEVVTKPTPTPLVQSCGLTVERPQPHEKVASVVTLVGTTSGCDWVATPTTALFAQVIDATGQPVSAYTTVPPLQGDGSTATFNTSIPLTGQASGQGTLILIPAQNTSGQSTSLRIPITFSSN